MDNLAVSKEVSRLYDQIPYASYDADYFPVFKSLGLNQAALRTFLAGKKVLEIGSGGGQLSLFMSALAKEVTAVDLSAKSLLLAQNKAAKMGVGNITFLQGDLFDANFAKRLAGQYDFVLCYGVLHHTFDPKQGFMILKTFLAPKGTLLVGVYSRTEWIYRLKRKIVLLFSGQDWQKREKWATRLFGRKLTKVSLYDGYVHPRVSFHSIAQIFDWGREAGLKYSGSWPPFEFSWYIKKIFGREILKSLNARKLGFFLVEMLWVLSLKSVMVSASFKNND